MKFPWLHFQINTSISLLYILLCCSTFGGQQLIWLKNHLLFGHHHYWRLNRDSPKTMGGKFHLPKYCKKWLQKKPKTECWNCTFFSHGNLLSVSLSFKLWSWKVLLFAKKVWSMKLRRKHFYKIAKSKLLLESLSVLFWDKAFNKKVLPSTFYFPYFIFNLSWIFMCVCQDHAKFSWTLTKNFSLAKPENGKIMKVCFFMSRLLVHSIWNSHFSTWFESSQPCRKTSKLWQRCCNNMERSKAYFYPNFPQQTLEFLLSYFN